MHRGHAPVRKQPEGFFRSKFCPIILRKNVIATFSQFFKKKYLNITFNSFKSPKERKKDMPCNPTNIYIGL
jgi:hypothetical protein